MALAEREDMPECAAMAECKATDGCQDLELKALEVSDREETSGVRMVVLHQPESACN